ncbi:MAG: FtsQ-type POTRA domain-containing protein [bacterium]|nr:FtsQ-type POTRA domain-containing protein [bacterium]MXZ30244.1 FtsQ-type POTRA domain-containing protein [Acidimicrobiia bacterium]MDE0667659.1 FtsQ-type POTRA domain-containing protein [bacterium]MYB23751.1 FtsQ-type POTRA domain-containing protein [Acidimicrobiia bacterium]MYE67365.1 FtsQ-type POTRA domain-containing protein [Acidimicrobiia bacterium]
MTVHAPGLTHPRIAQRRAAVDAATQLQESRRRRLLWLALAVGLALVCGYLVTRSEMLDVDRLEVRGAKTTDAAEIISASGIRAGEPLLGLDLAAARTRIARLPWVQDVYSKKSWDGAVQFSVTERSAAAAVAIPGAWAVVEEDGRVLALEPYPAAGMVPILGMNVAHAAPGDWLNADQRGAVAVASALYDPVKPAVRAIEAGSDGFVLNLHGAGRVLLGDGSRLGAKMLAVHTVMEQVNLRCLATLDVRAPGNPVLTRHNPCQ